MPERAKPGLRALPWLLVLTLIYIPKGGIKIGEIPITWGFVLIGLAMVYCTARNMIEGWGSLRRICCYLLTVPFLAVSAASIAANGSESFGNVVALFVTFFLLPLAFIVLFGKDIDDIEDREIISSLRRGVFFVCAVGIGLFSLHAATGFSLEIPLVTTALGDVSVDDKHNARVGVMKLISTYNNGNIFGVCMAMLLPLYYRGASIKGRAVARLAMVLTLSRTVWIGLVLVEFYSVMSRPKGVLFPIVIAGSILVAAVLVGGGLAILGKDTAFLFDSQLGGRISEVTGITDATFWPSTKFDGIAEIVYASVLTGFGWLGLITFLCAMIGPVIFSIDDKLFANESSRDIFAGLVIYLILAGSDGALLLIPTAAIYWALVSLLMRRKSVVQ